MYIDHAHYALTRWESKVGGVTAKLVLMDARQIGHYLSIVTPSYYSYHHTYSPLGTTIKHQL